jgi:chorismate mutase
MRAIRVIAGSGYTSMRVRLVVPIAGLLVAVAAGVGCRERPAAPAPAADGRLLGLIRQRLEVMHDVARWKWANGTPIADPVREGQVLDAVAERGRGRGLDPGFVRSFFAQQMEASKRVQQADFDRWKADGKGHESGGPDLAASRARIDAIDGELLGALADAGPERAAETSRRAGVGLAGEGR